MNNQELQNLINSQVQIINEQLEMISDPYQNSHIRVLFLQCLLNSADMLTDSGNILQGKDAIKENYKKTSSDALIDTINKTLDTPSEISLEDTNTEETVVDNKEQEPQKQEEVKEDSKEDNEEERMLIDIDGEVVDITDAYNYLDEVPEGDDKDEAAAIITVYGLMPILEQIKTKNTLDKVVLARYIQEYGLDQINEVINEMSDGFYKDIYESINDENIEAFVYELSQIAEE